MPVQTRSQIAGTPNMSFRRGSFSQDLRRSPRLAQQADREMREAAETLLSLRLQVIAEESARPRRSCANYSARRTVRSA